jgi:hypothetical protein
MPTRQEYDARTALDGETVAMGEAAKAGEELSGNLLREPTLRQMRLSREDLAIAADACHALAERHREDTQRHENEVLRDAALERARHAERLAHFFELQRDRG